MIIRFWLLGALLPVLSAQQSTGNLIQNAGFEAPGGSLPTVSVPPGNPCPEGVACLDLNGGAGTWGPVIDNVRVAPAALAANCTYVVEPASASFPAVGGTGAIRVTAPSGCSWNAVPAAPWITTSSSGSGSGVASYTVQANTASTPRSGLILIAGQIFMVYQAAASAGCTYVVSPVTVSFPASGGSGDFTVTAGPACAWTAASEVSWIVLISGASGSGNGTVRYSVAPNTGTAQRTGAVRVAGQTHTVTQPAAAGPVVAPGGVVNTADNSREFAPGGLITIQGTGLAAAEAASPRLPLALELADQVRVEVLAGGRVLGAPLFSVAPARISAQLPFDISGPSVQVRVRNSRGVSSPVSITVADQAPRVLTKDMPAGGDALAYHAGQTPVSRSSPAAPGETLLVYASGLGAVNPPVPAGSGGGDGEGAGPLNLVSGAVRVLVDGQTAQLVSACLAPDLAGVYLVRFIVPAVPAGESVSLQIAVNGQISPAGATLAYRSGWEVLGAGRITPDGGVLDAGGISLALPPGAVTGPAEISVYRAAPGDSAERPGAAASGLYAVRGLPPEASRTLSLELSRPPGELECWIWERGDEPWQPGLRWYPARTDGTRATVDLPGSAIAEAEDRWKPPAAAAAGAPAAADPGTLYYQAIFLPSPPVFHSSDRKFQVQYSDWSAVALEPNWTAFFETGKAVAEVLPEAKDRLEALGLSWEGRTTWPFDVYLYDFRGAWDSLTNSPDEWGVLNHSRVSPNWYTISLNLAKLAPSSALSRQQIEKIRQVVSHELFHMLQVLYDGRGNLYASEGPATWYWFHEAASTWFERRMTEDKTFIPDTVRPLEFVEEQSDNYAAFIKEGLEFQSSSVFRVQNHGYGASMFLEHLGRAFGDSIIGDILKLKMVREPMGTLKYSPVQAIAEVLRQRGSSVGEEWRAFCRNLMAGTVYEGTAFPTPSLILGTLRSGAANEAYRARFSAGSPPSASFSWSSPDLSARLYLANFDSPLAANAKLVIEFTDSFQGNSEVILYRVGAGGLWEPLGSVRPGLAREFPDAGNLFRAGQALAMLVANGNGTYTFTQRANLKLTVRIELPPDPALALLRGLRAEFNGDHSCRRTPNTSSTCYTSAFKIDTAVDQNVTRYELQPVQVTWKGASFEVRGTARGKFMAGFPETLEYTFNITGDLDAPDGNLVRANLDMTKIGRYGEKEVVKYTLTNLRRKAPNYVYELTGPQVKDHISGISYQYFDPAGALTMEYSGTNWSSAPAPSVMLQLVK